MSETVQLMSNHLSFNENNNTRGRDKPLKRMKTRVHFLNAVKCNRTLPNELKSNDCSTEIHVWNVLSSHSSDNPKVRKKTTKFWARSRGLTKL